MPEMPLIKFIDGWETVEEMEAALDIPAGNLVATLDRYNEHAAAGEDPDFHKQPEYLAPQDERTVGGIRPVAGPGDVLRVHDGRAGGDGRRRGAARRRRRIPGLYAAAHAPPTSPRTARATPAARSWAKAPSSAAVQEPAAGA